MILRGFWPNGLLCLLLSLLVLFPSGQAAAQDYPGTYSLTVSVSPTVKLFYVLILNPPNKAGMNTGHAEMRIARKGTIKITGTLPDDYGSMLYLYLKDRERTNHVGDWTRSGNRVEIRLSTIEGRRDRAEFKGALEGKRLILTCSNPGMYGHKVEYRMKRDLEASDSTIVGQYRLVREENIEGQTLRLEYTLLLRTNSEAEMRVVCEQAHGNDGKVGSVFGSLATHYLQGGVSRVVHRGNWKRSDGSITITLTEIMGRRDRAEFTGSITPEQVELNCNNRGMYGVTKLVMPRDNINTIGPGLTSD